MKEADSGLYRNAAIVRRGTAGTALLRYRGLGHVLTSDRNTSNCGIASQQLAGQPIFRWRTNVKARASRHGNPHDAPGWQYASRGGEGAFAHFCTLLLHTH